MDTTERQTTSRLLAVSNTALQQPGADAPAVAVTLLQQNMALQAKLASFIPEPPEPTAGVDDWRQVSGALREDDNGGSILSRLSPNILPAISKTQGNRVRVESKQFLLIRQPTFSDYEKSILQSDQEFFGLIGPQGFGKSTFLYYFSIKYSAAPRYLVVYLPDFPADAHTVHRRLAQAFYRGCRIAQLTGYAEQTHEDSLTVLVQKFSDFAGENGRRLILVIDQMRAKASHFASTVASLRDVSRIKLVLSSSTSDRVSSVFGSDFLSLRRYAFKISPDEATLLGHNVAGLPFLVAINKMFRPVVSLVEEAQKHARSFLRRRDEAEAQIAYVYLQMTADAVIKVHERDCMFGIALDGDSFYVEQVEGGYCIKEHFDGLAAEIIAQMKSHAGEYEAYLLGLVTNANFMLLDPGARGRILEDCYGVIFRRGGVLLPFFKIPEGGKSNPPFLNIDASSMSVIEVPGSDEAVPGTIEWGVSIDTLVFIPHNRQYKGLDFIIARRTEKVVYVYFIQCTIQYPQDRGICESNLYKAWVDLLRSSTTLTVQSFLVYMTPHGSHLNVPTGASMAKYLARKPKLHVQFAQVESGHELCGAIMSRYPRNTA